MASQITSLTIVYSTVYSGVDQRKHQSSALLAFVRGIHRWPVNSPRKGPVSRKMFPFDDVIMRKPENWWLATCALHEDVAIWESFLHYWPLVIEIHRSQVVPFISMMTSSNGCILCVTGPLCGNSPVTGDFPSQRPVRWFDNFSDLRLNKWLDKQWLCCWFETLSRSLSRTSGSYKIARGSSLCMWVFFYFVL